MVEWSREFSLRTRDFCGSHFVLSPCQWRCLNVYQHAKPKARERWPHPNNFLVVMRLTSVLPPNGRQNKNGEETRKKATVVFAFICRHRRTPFACSLEIWRSRQNIHYILLDFTLVNSKSVSSDSLNIILIDGQGNSITQ